MNKSILMSIQPQWLCKILNGEKTIEIRKKFPKDYVGWVYIYCTKGKEYLFKDTYLISGKEGYFLTKCGDVNFLNGKVVARFWCDKVEEIFPLAMDKQTEYETLTKNWNTLYKLSCLSQKEMFDYLGDRNEGGYAIHISKLEVFERPKEIGNFWKITKYTKIKNFTELAACEQLTKAPQSWCYVEGE